MYLLTFLRLLCNHTSMFVPSSTSIGLRRSCALHFFLFLFFFLQRMDNCVPYQYDFCFGFLVLTGPYVPLLYCSMSHVCVCGVLASRPSPSPTFLLCTSEGNELTERNLVFHVYRVTTRQWQRIPLGWRYAPQLHGTFSYEARKYDRCEKILTCQTFTLI